MSFERFDGLSEIFERMHPVRTFFYYKVQSGLALVHDDERVRHKDGCIEKGRADNGIRYDQVKFAIFEGNAGFFTIEHFKKLLELALIK
ncbi:hypothetical protein YDYSG_46370 [Paenibacillus tyrfis]|nr:hypothetical protein YDYSG_46370 [Paenibacillus tyrfis]